MKRSIFKLIVIGVAIFFLGCTEDSLMTPESDQSDLITHSLKSSKKPAPNLTGSMDLYFVLEAVWPEDPVWVGTIYFEEYGEYGMRFYHLSPFKAGLALPLCEVVVIGDVGAGDGRQCGQMPVLAVQLVDQHRVLGHGIPGVRVHR